MIYELFIRVRQFGTWHTFQTDEVIGFYAGPYSMGRTRVDRFHVQQGVVLRGTPRLGCNPSPDPLY